MPYNFVTDTIHTNKLCSRLFSSDVGPTILHGKRPFCVLKPPLAGGAYRVTPDVPLRLIGLPISVN